MQQRRSRRSREGARLVRVPPERLAGLRDAGTQKEALELSDALLGIAADSFQRTGPAGECWVEHGASAAPFTFTVGLEHADVWPLGIMVHVDPHSAERSQRGEHVLEGERVYAQVAHGCDHNGAAQELLEF